MVTYSYIPPEYKTKNKMPLATSSSKPILTKVTEHDAKGPYVTDRSLETTAEYSPRTMFTNPPTKHVTFGHCPKPDRTKTAELHRTLHSYVAAKPSAASTLDQIVPADKIKSMSDLDKEEEIRICKSYSSKAKKGVAGVVDWLESKVKGDGKKKK
ncbi:hypothetical protein E8E13_009673 [Curvularia kusanoi]|uniref:Uncharacterized protein n=1 Tax=Curvularia kusanoi TaxID=90978 RepID=A0A9P4TLJ2_CURKU|nr:hypothetical protein E8E13_009673 [Curvularia kusanoi]